MGRAIQCSTKFDKNVCPLSGDRGNGYAAVITIKHFDAFVNIGDSKPAFGGRAEFFICHTFAIVRDGDKKIRLFPVDGDVQFGNLRHIGRKAVKDCVLAEGLYDEFGNNTVKGIGSNILTEEGERGKR